MTTSSSICLDDLSPQGARLVDKILEDRTEAHKLNQHFMAIPPDSPLLAMVAATVPSIVTGETYGGWVEWKYPREPE